MHIRFVDNPPEGVFHFRTTPEEQAEPQTTLMTTAAAEHIAELFNTPLTGAYNWDYEVTNQKLWKLYELGKKLNWDAQIDIDWASPKLDKTKDLPMDDAFLLMPFIGWEPFEELSEQEKMALRWHGLADTISNFVHGEQGALLVASQLCTCAPTEEAKLYAASQTFDEARHVEVYRKYLEDRVGYMYPCNDSLKALLDKVLTDPRWDLKFIGMQIVIESLALAAFELMAQMSYDPVLRQITGYVMRDEGRHVGFGVNFLEEYYKSGVLSRQEIEERAMFTYEAAYLMRERLIPTRAIRHVFPHWDMEEVLERVMRTTAMEMFRQILFTKLMPNIKKIGLLTDNVRPLYEKIGALEYEDLPDSASIDWVAVSKPYARSQSEAAA